MQPEITADRTIHRVTFEGHGVRYEMSEGTLWFVAVDVLQALGTKVGAGVASYLGPFKNTLRRLPRPKGVGGNPPTAIPHLALLSFLQRSRRDLAPALLRFLAEDVLPKALPGFRYTVHRPELKAHQERRAAEREARRVATEYRKAQRDTEREAQRGTAKAQREAAKASKRVAYQRKAPERIAHLSALLSGTDPSERINSEEEWDVTASELRKLWPLSGDKQCASCKAIVPPTAMLPPGPGNFYPGKCQSCAGEEVRANRLKVGCKDPEGPRPVHLRDGTTVTIGDIARHHRELEKTYRVKRWSGRVNLGRA